MKFVLTAIKPRRPIVELKFSDYKEYQRQKLQYYRDCYSVAGYVETHNEGEIQYEDIPVQY